MPETVSSPAIPAQFDDALEHEIRAHGAALIEHARRVKPGVLSGAFWSDKLMTWAMRDTGFKVALFRFVDVLPRLQTADDVHAHLVDYLGRPDIKLPPGLALGLKAGGLVKGTSARFITGRIEGMASKFIAGRDVDAAQPVLRALWKRGIAHSLDLLGEACLSEREAERNSDHHLTLVESLADLVADWALNPRLESDHLGPIPRANVSIKISALVPDLDPLGGTRLLDQLTEALAPILQAAAARNVLINFDMEQYAYKDLTLDLFMRCCEQFDFPAGLAMQAYLRSGVDDGRRIIDWSRAIGRQVTVRLVKGAYWDYETIHAREEGWPIPVWSRKPDSDASFERMAAQFIECMPRTAEEGGVKLALGSHNARSISAVLALLSRHDLPTDALELQMLHGMADELKDAVVARGYRLREYVPVGEMIPGMAYLVRRLLENTSNESWLRAGFHDEADLDVLLASPHTLAPETLESTSTSREPRRNFSVRAVRDAFDTAVAATTEVPPPPAPSTVDIDTSIRAAATWAALPVRDRVERLTQLASILADRRDAVAATLVRAPGKCYRDADAEVCCAINSIRAVADAATDVLEPSATASAASANASTPAPAGPAILLPRWTAPIASTAAPLAALLATGAPIVVAPPVGAHAGVMALIEMAHAAGIPADLLVAVNGEDTDALATFITSGPFVLAAGAHGETLPDPLRLAIARLHGAQPSKPRTSIAIVDTTANLDEAVLAIRNAAFGFQGQRRSACGRVIVTSAIADAFIERLAAATDTLQADRVVESSTDLTELFADDVLEGFTAARARLLASADAVRAPEPDGRLARPQIFSVESAGPPTAADVVGPILVIERASDFQAAIDRAIPILAGRSTAVYSATPRHLDAARGLAAAETLLINRSIGSGGMPLALELGLADPRQYLGRFIRVRTISEGTMRGGLSSEMPDAG